VSSEAPSQGGYSVRGGPTAPTRDPGSFRDPDSGVLLAGGGVYRYFSAGAASGFNELKESGLLAALIEGGLAIESVPLERDAAPEAYEAAGRAELIVRHPRLPFISYPYEWPFEMLQEAALVQLELTLRALDSGFMLKDATPYNFQFVNGRPLLIDVGSFERYEEGAPWMAYTQFCRTFLNPLLLQSFTGVPFQPWLRSSLEGIDASHLSSLLPLRRKFRRAVFLDVVLQASLNRRQVSKKQADGSETKMRPIPREVIVGTVKRLQGAIRTLKRHKGTSAWEDYEIECPSYTPEAIGFKDRFVEAAVQAAQPEMVWDLGCNTGRYSVVAARHARNVVAMEGDEPTTGALYGRLREHGNILPLVVDLLNPSPGQGWAHEERRSLAARGPADFALCLALVHHLAIGGNVPLERFAEWLATVAKAGVVEFVPKEDPMVKTLLRTRRDVFSDYGQEVFETALERHFSIEEVAPIPDSQRLLYRIAIRR
jgi:ribosomal protein L11 methylase PrmA